MATCCPHSYGARLFHPVRRMSSSRSRALRLLFDSTWFANTTHRLSSFGWFASVAKMLRGAPSGADMPPAPSGRTSSSQSSSGSGAMRGMRHDAPMPAKRAARLLPRDGRRVPFAPSSWAQSPRMSCSTTRSWSHSSTNVPSSPATCSSSRETMSRRCSTFPSTRWVRFSQRVQRVAAAVEVGLGADGSFVAMNNRVSQSVAHLHVHVVPRHRGDGLRGFFLAASPVSARRSRGDRGEGSRCARLTRQMPNSARQASRPSMQMSSRRLASQVCRGSRRWTSRSPPPCRTPMRSPFGS